MKISETLSMRSGILASRSNRSLGSLAAFLSIISLFGGDDASAAGSTRRILREYGYRGTYSGVVRGVQSSRIAGNSPFVRERISKLGSFKVAPPIREVVTDPKGEGRYLLLNRISANKIRATIRGVYYGKALNENLGNPGKVTTRQGLRRLTIKRNNRQGTIRSAQLLDRISEFDQDNISVVLASWTVRGSLSK